MTERQEEQAALNAVYSLDAHERQILRAEMRTDPRLRDLAAEFEDAAAQLALLLPPEAPPEEARPLLLKALKQRARAKGSSAGLPWRFLFGPRVAWAVAACLALVWWQGRAGRQELTQKVAALSQGEAAARDAAAQSQGKLAALEKDLADARERADRMTGEIASLKQVNALARMEVTALRATVRRFDEGVAVIVWDSERQEGRLKLEKMPPVQANKDYQLWVIDRKNPAPVSAGVIKVDARGMAAVTFKPADAVPAAAKFAISIEALGGVPKKSSDGPIIFAGP
jgi:anti-sigma-K factor RskA